ncbi:MAG: IMP cyclohydrolase [Planctomycetes bacterium]|nr:IMP cyclohydrolase [Planctomycetota bacterium]
MEATRKKYFTKHVGEYPDEFEFMGRKYVKVEDLRYGTNPNQTAAYFRPADAEWLVIGDMQILKTGKSGLSETNLEDVHHALGIIKYFDAPACAVMKHLNPSGAAMQVDDESLKDVYVKARDGDPVAAFGSVVAFNRTVDLDTADEIMTTIVEGVVAPDYEDGALDRFHDNKKYGKNKDIRIIRINDLGKLPRFAGDPAPDFKEVKVLLDGSLVLADPYLSSIRSVEDFQPAFADHPKKGKITISRAPTPQEAADMLFTWYVNFNVRSNGVIVGKNGVVMAAGTGQQDRVSAVRQAIAKVAEKYVGPEKIEGAVLASDAFFPAVDSIEECAKAGISAIVQPGGSVMDYECVQLCNEHDIAMVFTGERCFSHH